MLLLVLLHFAAELEYDWRARFGVGLREFATDRVTVTEAVRWTAGVLADPDSRTTHAVRAARAEAEKSTPEQLTAQQDFDAAWARGDLSPADLGQEG